MREIGNDAEELLKLVHHSVQQQQGSAESLDTFLASDRCDSRVICRAMGYAARDGYSIVPDMSRQLLAVLLQAKLTEEHVAAQRQMSAAADQMQQAALKVSKASWGLALAAVVLGIATLIVAV